MFAGAESPLLITQGFLAVASLLGALAAWRQSAAHRAEVSEAPKTTFREDFKALAEDLQEERHEAREEARRLHEEVVQCRGECAAVRDALARTTADLEATRLELGVANRRIAALEADKADLLHRLEHP